MAQKSPISRKNVVILGGSYGGVSAAHYILKHVVPNLPEKECYQVIIISVASEALCRPACPRALISDDMFPQDKLFVSISKQFEQYSNDSFRFINARVTNLDHAERTVSINSATGVDSEELDFHALVIATGASTSSPLLGLSGGEQALRSSWATFRPALSSANSIVIAGGGPTGIEIAGELGEFLNGRASWFKSESEKPKVSITVVTSGPNILPLLRPAIAAKAERYLAQVGVVVVKNARVATVTPDGAGTQDIATKTTVTLEGGKILEVDLYIPAFGTTANAGFVDASLLTADGRVDTNPATMRVDKAGPRIYAIGDVSSWARPAVHNVLGGIPILCANAKRDLLLAAGKDESSVGVDRVFKEDTREMQLVPIGRNKGVGAAMGWQLPSFLIWLIKGRDYWLWTTGNLWSGKQWNKES
jgi:NADH dehydrogenase FAD-containing subunit